MDITRKGFITGAAAAVSSVLAGTGVACADTAHANEVVELPAGVTADDLVASCVELEPIADFAEEQTYDIVVVGAGCAGVAAVATALEEGATVGCLQKEEGVAANGSAALGVIKGRSTAAGIKRWMTDWANKSNRRVNWDLYSYFVDHSEETMSWLYQRGLEAGGELRSRTANESIRYDDGELEASFKFATTNNQDFITKLAAKAEADGAVFYWSTPAVQLIQDEDGTVTGVVGKRADGTYIRLSAERGVILAAGDYMNNDSMVERYSADAMPFWRKQKNRTGDGHILGSLAGGRIAPANHPRMIHGLIPGFTVVPLLMLDKDALRFANENMVMSDFNTCMAYRYHENGATNYIYRLFDAKLDEKYAAFPTAVKLETIDKAIDDNNTLYYYRADTLDELAEQLELPVDTFKASVERYNELCALGSDEDFGVPGEMLHPIDTPPFYCLRDFPGIAALTGGVLVDKNYQVIDADRNPIPHLFAAGMQAGDLCGGINWHMPGGMSNGHCFNAGRYTVIYALTGGFEPKNPCSFDQIADDWKDDEGKFVWETDKCPTVINVW